MKCRYLRLIVLLPVRWQCFVNILMSLKKKKQRNWPKVVSFNFRWIGKILCAALWCQRPPTPTPTEFGHSPCVSLDPCWFITFVMLSVLPSCFWGFIFFHALLCDFWFLFLHKSFLLATVSGSHLSSVPDSFEMSFDVILWCTNKNVLIDCFYSLP